VRWAEPQRRVAPGQSVVFYDLDDRRVLGGGLASLAPR
jgi:tRNA-specific 2-thiouridylase